MPAAYREETLVDLTELRVQRRRVPAMRAEEPPKRIRISLIFIMVLLAGAIASAAIVSSQSHSSAVRASGAATTLDGLSPEDARAIPDIGNWTMAGPSDLGLNFREWLRAFGVDPAARIDLDAHGTAEPSGAAYLLVTQKSPELKRVVWIVDHQVVYDTVEKIQGIARVPASAMSRLQWSESAMPVAKAEGDGLMLIRNYTSPGGVAIFFVKNQKCYSGIPAN